MLWLLCTNCVEASVKTSAGTIFPGIMPGPSIEGMPKDVAEAYGEARRAYSSSAYTACELMCRKLLMHVGVEKGAKEGSSFAEYLAHLENAGYVTPPMKGWVDLIRKHGNDATHKLAPADAERALSTLMFTAELLRLVFEMEFMAKKFTEPKRRAI